MKKTVYIIGHRNPDTDSIVAATAYARLKQLLGFNEYVAARAGKLAPQTEYIFNRFKVQAPQYIPDLLPKTAYYMSEECDTVDENSSLWHAAHKMQNSSAKILPLVDKNGCYKALLHYNAFAQNILGILNPENEAAITTSVELIKNTLGAQPLILKNENKIFKGTVLVSAAELDTFKAQLNEHLSENVIVIAGDRKNIQEYCIEMGVKALVITSGFLLDKDLQAKAEKKGVSVLSSPFDTSATAMLIVYSTPVSIIADKNAPAVHEMDTVQKIRPLLQESPSRSLPVVDDYNKVIGLISENDLINEPNVEVILVDHNELSQAVEGVEHYIIKEIIDHHRLGNLSTKYPITFINKPVGSTATLVTGLYRENRVSIPKDMAELLLCGILSDTLILQSGTTTDVDRKTAEYLSNITGLDIKQLGNDIVSAGSHIGNRAVTEVIHQDMKEYNDDKIKYTVSQIEVDSTDEVMKRKKEFLDELEIERRSHGGLFAALLVTDITKLSSIMLIASDEKFLPSLKLPKNENQVYYLKDVVSRKKQLIPLLSEQIGRYASI